MGSRHDRPYSCKQAVGGLPRGARLDSDRGRARAAAAVRNRAPHAPVPPPCDLQSIAPWVASAALWWWWRASRCGGGRDRAVVQHAQLQRGLLRVRAARNTAPAARHAPGAPLISLCWILHLCMQTTLQNAKYSEIVEVRLGDGTIRKGQVLEVDGTRAVVQVGRVLSAEGARLCDPHLQCRMTHGRAWPLVHELCGSRVRGAVCRRQCGNICRGCDVRARTAAAH